MHRQMQTTTALEDPSFSPAFALCSLLRHFYAFLLLSSSTPAYNHLDTFLLSLQRLSEVSHMRGVAGRAQLLDALGNGHAMTQSPNAELLQIILAKLDQV